MILYIFYKYMRYFFNTEGINYVKEIMIYFCMLLWLLFVNPSLPEHLKKVSVFLIIFLLTWQYKEKFAKKVCIVLMIYGSYILCEMFTGYLLLLYDQYMHADTFFAGKAILTLFFMYVCEQITELLADCVKKIRFELAQSESAKRQAQGYVNQMDVMKNSEERVRGLRHDLKHHLNELMILAEREEASEMKKYIKNMDAFMVEPREYVSSGNMDIDSLLNLMMNIAKQELDDVSCKVSIPRELSIDPFDLNVILGNLLDNAIFAAKKTQKKYLRVKINYKKGMLFIYIENSYEGELIREGARYGSTKKDSTMHGLGLENVRFVVGKYDGNLELKNDKQLFQAKAVLYVPAKE